MLSKFVFSVLRSVRKGFRYGTECGWPSTGLKDTGFMEQHVQEEAWDSPQSLILHESILFISTAWNNVQVDAVQGGGHCSSTSGAGSRARTSRGGLQFIMFL